PAPIIKDDGFGQTGRTPSCSGFGYAKSVRGAKNQSRVLRKQGSGIKRQAAEQIVSLPELSFI
ncbi:hypothetical protein KKB18_10545, partial [bacterium]|nr:hypothetical protein [bacterium]